MLVKVRVAAPLVLLAFLLGLPVAPAARAQTGADKTRLTPVTKPVTGTRVTGAKRGRSPIRLTALETGDQASVTALSEEEGLLALEQDLSLKVGKQLQLIDYPTEAVRWRWTGTVLVAVMITGNGVVKDVALSRTSGFRVLDERALIVVRRVSKLFVPAGLRARERTVTVPVGFYLQNL